MPQFQLDHGNKDGADWFRSLSEFAQGFVEAMFFTDTSTDDDGDLASASVSELAPQTRADIVEFTEQWANTNADLLARAWRDVSGYDETQAGRDLWFSGNGHGVGFGERGLPPDLGDALDTASLYVCTSRSLYRGDDGLIYWH